MRYQTALRPDECFDCIAKSFEFRLAASAAPPHVAPDQSILVFDSDTSGNWPFESKEACRLLAILSDNWPLIRAAYVVERQAPRTFPYGARQRMPNRDRENDAQRAVQRALV